jgi:hypothetical protein
VRLILFEKRPLYSPAHEDLWKVGQASSLSLLVLKLEFLPPIAFPESQNLRRVSIYREWPLRMMKRTSGIDLSPKGPLVEAIARTGHVFEDLTHHTLDFYGEPSLLLLRA